MYYLGGPTYPLSIQKPEDCSFDMGPMGAIGEQGSLLLRINRNCPWNRCLFCSAYKSRRFEYRTVEAVKRDIDVVAVLADEIVQASLDIGPGGQVTPEVVEAIVLGNEDLYGEGVNTITRNSRLACLTNVARWLGSGARTVFLQDANALIMRTPELVEVVSYLKETFPSVERVTSYARSHTCSRKGVQGLKDLYDAGLSRVLVGLESGYDPVLGYMQKGVTAEEHIRGGRSVVESGMSLVEFVMPGLGGKKWSEGHGLETVRVLNEIRPNLIRIRSLAIQEDTPLYERWRAGEFEPPSDDQMVDEIRLLVEGLDFDCDIETGQLTNILFEISGRLPRDRDRILGLIVQYQAMAPDERLRFRLDRYTEHYFPYVRKRGKSDYVLEQLLEQAWEGVDAGSPDAHKVEQAILTMKSRCIP